MGGQLPRLPRSARAPDLNFGSAAETLQVSPTLVQTRALRGRCRADLWPTPIGTSQLGPVLPTKSPLQRPRPVVSRRRRLMRPLHCCPASECVSTSGIPPSRRGNDPVCRGPGGRRPPRQLSFRSARRARRALPRSPDLTRVEASTARNDDRVARIVVYAYAYLWCVCK